MRGKIIFLITIPYLNHRLCRYAQFSNGKGAPLNPTNLIITYSLPLFFLLSVSCQSTGTGKLTDAERRMCDSIGIDQALIAKLRSQGASPVELFNDSIYGNEIETRVDAIPLKGLVFKAMPGPCERMLERNHDIFQDNGYALFVLERHFGIGKKPDIMAVLATIDKFKILGTIGTNGLNYDIDNDSIISVIRELDRKYSLDLIGAGGDWCEFFITKPPDDWAELAKEVYAFCPDIVDQGTGTVEALEHELKSTKRLYFWWD